MKLLFVDTETTGVDPTKARMVELGALLVEITIPDEAPAKLIVEHKLKYETLVQPEDFIIPPEAEAIHGISEQACMRLGVPLTEALQQLSDMALDARPGKLIAHNLRYDLTVLTHEYKRIDYGAYPLNHLFPFCTMQSMTPICNLPGRYGKAKWPKLQEAYDHCYGQGTFASHDGNAHRAMFDVGRTLDIYMHGLRKGWWSL